MPTTIQLKNEEPKSKDYNSWLAKLNETYAGRWVAILESGDIIAQEALADVYKEAAERSLKIMALFRASKKDQLLFK